MVISTFPARPSGPAALYDTGRRTDIDTLRALVCIALMSSHVVGNSGHRSWSSRSASSARVERGFGRCAQATVQFSVQPRFCGGGIAALARAGQGAAAAGPDGLCRPTVPVLAGACLDDAVPAAFLVDPCAALTQVWYMHLSSPC